MYALYTMETESTKTRLFQAARVIFDDEGEAGLSMRRIASAVGITPMAIYKHYADKDALLNALMLDGFVVWRRASPASPTRTRQPGCASSAPRFSISPSRSLAATRPRSCSAPARHDNIQTTSSQAARR